MIKLECKSWRIIFRMFLTQRSLFWRSSTNNAPF